MIWMLGCLIISTFINHGVGRNRCSLGSQTRIWYGNEADAHSWPWIVSIQLWTGDWKGLDFPRGKWTHNCGGSIISERVVISAAHCFEKVTACDQYTYECRLVPAANIYIIPGLHAAKLPPITESFSEWKMGNEVPVHPIHKVYTPIGWNKNSGTMIHDLAIVIVKTPFIFNILNPKIAPIKLDFRPEYEILKDVHCCKVAGWGRMEDGEYANKLQEVGLPIFDLNTCANNYAEYSKENNFKATVTSDAFCAGTGKDKKDSCFGDSGGPILCNYQKENYLTGVVSFGPSMKCGISHIPGVYTKISSFEPIIKQVLMDSPKFNSSNEYYGLKVMKLWKKE